MIQMKPVVLTILDGWGYSEALENNAIAKANTPTWDALWQKQPHMLLDASGHAVGLPDKQMGNSEVGHLNIGAGRIIPQDLTRINEAIANSEFKHNVILQQAFEKTQKNNSTLHIMGLLSPGGVHSHEAHLFTLIEYAQQANIKNIIVHPFLDGRDTAPKSAQSSLEKLERLLKKNGGLVGTLCGRFYAMDRDQRLDRNRRLSTTFVKW